MVSLRGFDRCPRPKLLAAGLLPLSSVLFSLASRTCVSSADDTAAASASCVRTAALNSAMVGYPTARLISSPSLLDRPLPPLEGPTSDDSAPATPRPPISPTTVRAPSSLNFSLGLLSVPLEFSTILSLCQLFAVFEGTVGGASAWTARKNGPGTWQRGQRYGAGAMLVSLLLLLATLPSLLVLLAVVAACNSATPPRARATATVCSYHPKMLFVEMCESVRTGWGCGPEEGVRGKQHQSCGHTYKTFFCFFVDSSVRTLPGCCRATDTSLGLQLKLGNKTTAS